MWYNDCNLPLYNYALPTIAPIANYVNSYVCYTVNLINYYSYTGDLL